MIKKLLCILILASGFLQAWAQEISGTHAMEDMIMLKESIKIYQPALNIYNPDFEQNSDELLNQPSPQNVSLLAHFANLSELCALSNEGHFGLGNWEDTVHAGFLENEFSYLPLSLKIPKEQLLVWLDNSEEQQLSRGDEILSINGLESKDILDVFMRKYPADGSIPTYVIRTLEMGFNWMYYLYIEQPEYFELEVRKRSGTIEKVKIKALTRSHQFENYARVYPDRPKKSENSTSSFFTLTHHEAYSCLALPSFDRAQMEEYGIKPGRFYRELFKEFNSKKVQNLVIDLRGNTGGRNEMADEMVPYILQDDCGDDFLKKSISWEGRERTYKLPSPAKYLFKGQIYVLVDGRTFSAGSTLARYLKEYGKARIIGEESGSRYEGYAAGSKHYIQLRHSKLEIGIPRYHISYPKSEKQPSQNRGVLPDHQIEYTWEDLLESNDLHLEKAEQLINSTSPPAEGDQE